MRKQAVRTDFAGWVKNHTSNALKLSVPLGHMESQPMLSQADYDERIRENRLMHCFDGTMSGQSRQTRAVVAAEGPNRPQPAPSEEPISVDSGPPADDPKPVVIVEQSDPTENTRQSGRGGKQHKYLQERAKELGEELGFKATLEKPLSKGNGRVDVALESQEKKIAVEISITSADDYEIESARRCLQDGYDHVVIVVQTKKRCLRMLEKLKDVLDEGQIGCTDILLFEALEGSLTPLADQEVQEDPVIKGYSVKVRSANRASDDPRAVVAGVILKSLKHPKK